MATISPARPQRLKTAQPSGVEIPGTTDPEAVVMSNQRKVTVKSLDTSTKVAGLQFGAWASKRLGLAAKWSPEGKVHP
jgi:hypothetical protein